MRRVFSRIAERQSAYQNHPFILYLKDERLSPHQRLAYAPFACHFVMTFSEFNRSFLHSQQEGRRGEVSRAAKGGQPDGADSGAGHQNAIDVHAEEDGRHYSWFLQDLKALGYDVDMSFCDALRFLFSDKGFRTRDLGYYAIGAVRDADPEVRLAVIEAMEAMGNVWLSATVRVARQHPAADRLIYFGQYHLDRETGHAIGSDEAQTGQIELSEQQASLALELVDGLYDRMEAFNMEVLQRVRAAYSDEGADASSAIRGFRRY